MQVREVLAVVAERGNAVLKGVDGMDKAKILRLCNEIEDEVTDIAFNSTHKHIYDFCESIREYLKAIAAEITAPPKSNADRIRQMTDEELAESIGLACKRCAYCAGNKCTGCDKECAEGNLKWLKQEVEKDDER
jgi:hypothetical protein